MVSGDLSTDLGWGMVAAASLPAGDERPPRPQEEIKVRRRSREEPENAEDPEPLDAGDPGHQIDRLA